MTLFLPVNEVYPELAIKGPDGQLESVQYAKLPALLLNELQKQYRKAQEQAIRVQEQGRRINEQAGTIQKLEARLAALEAQSVKATAKLASEKPDSSTEGGH